MAENKKSLIWEYFEASSMSATCKLCKKASKRSHGNTSNLTAHFKKDHRHKHQAMQVAGRRSASEDGGGRQQIGTRILPYFISPDGTDSSTKVDLSR